MKKKNTDWGERKEKETDFKVPTAHGDRKWKGRGFDRVSLWVSLSDCGAEDGGVCSCGSRMGVCAARAFFVGLTSERVCSVDRGCWVRAHGSRGGRHPAVCQSAGWRMTTIWIESVQHNSRRGRVVIAGKNAGVEISHRFSGLEIPAALITQGQGSRASNQGSWWEVI